MYSLYRNPNESAFQTAILRDSETLKPRGLAAALLIRPSSNSHAIASSVQLQWLPKDKVTYFEQSFQLAPDERSWLGVWLSPVRVLL